MNRWPLNPCDYFTLALDEEIRQEGLAGNLCALVMTLSQAPDVAQLTERIAQLSVQFPRLLASLQQHGARFYWCERPTRPQIFFDYQSVADEDDDLFQHTQLEKLMNDVQPRADIAPLTFHLLRSRYKNTLVIRWLHPLCDALGVSLIVRYLCADSAEQQPLFHAGESKALIFLQLEKISLWQKARLFFKAYRHINEIDQQRSILPAQAVSPQRLHYQAYQLPAEQVTTLLQHARRYVGLTSTSLYFIGCLMRALEKLTPAQPGEAYCIPYAFNLRKQKALTPLFGNHIGTLFPQAARALLNDRTALFTHLKQQHAQAIRQQLDYAFLPVMWAASFLSLKKHGDNLRHSYQHGTERSSCLFSHVNLTDLASQRLGGSAMSDFFYLSHVPSPPGLALLISQQSNTLSLSYNYVTPLFSAAQITQLHQFMVQELMDEAT